jgi:TetR/AcrR family transcriptional repressor of nem operon
MGRPKQFDPDAAVASAMHVFWQQGYAATTPGDLVEALGIGKGSLYLAFASKRGLFEQALRRYGDERVAALTEVLGRPGSARVRLRAALERLVAPEQAKLRRRGCLAVNTAAELGASDEAAAAIVRSVFDRMESALRATIDDGQRRGELDAELDAAGLASLMLSTLLGMTVLGKTVARPDRLSRIVDAMMALV